MGTNEVRFDDGNWHGMTLGHFISLLVDAGDNDVAVAMRVVADTPSDKDGHFTRHMEMALIPNGSVVRTLEHGKVFSVHKTLKALIDAGEIK